MDEASGAASFPIRRLNMTNPALDEGIGDLAPSDNLIGTRTVVLFNALCDPKLSVVSLIDKLSASEHPRLSCAVATRTGLHLRRRDSQFPEWIDERSGAV